MKKIRLSLFLCAALALPLSAENIHLLTLGLRGGEMTVLQQSAQNLNNQLGGVGALDLGYIWYAPIPKADLGIRTGLLFGYGASAIGGGSPSSLPIPTILATKWTIPPPHNYMPDSKWYRQRFP